MFGVIARQAKITCESKPTYIIDSDILQRMVVINVYM